MVVQHASIASHAVNDSTKQHPHQSIPHTLVSDDGNVFTAVTFTTQVGSGCYGYITWGCCHDCAAFLPVRRPGHQQTWPRPSHHAGHPFPSSSLLHRCCSFSRVLREMVIGTFLLVPFCSLFLFVWNFLCLAHIAVMSFLQVLSAQNSFS